MSRKSISAIRAAAGKAGAAARWGGPRETKTVRVFGADAAKLSGLAAKRRECVADVVHTLMRRH